METSQWLWSANQLTGVYMRIELLTNGLMAHCYINSTFSWNTFVENLLTWISPRASFSVCWINMYVVQYVVQLLRHRKSFFKSLFWIFDAIFPALKIKILVSSVKMSGRFVFWSDMSCSYFPKFGRSWTTEK